ncbi:MAG: homoserine kinase [Acidimicrobiia bacterium]|nr:homoserine kinase [Acidimicrobiia bacterium]
MKASAPASSANLGPGFDCLALALDIRCEVEVAVGAGGVLTPDPDGFVARWAGRLSDEALEVRVTSDIPVGRGLGSSAALVTALAAAVQSHQGNAIDRRELFDLVAETEGHPDNAGAAVYGGFIHAGPGGIHPLPIHDAWLPVVAVPEVTLATDEARRHLPESVPLAVASRTVARVALLVEALRTGDADLLAAVTPDELHEPHRIALRPIIGDLMAAGRSAGAAYCAISGSGPSVLALATESTIDQVTRGLRDAGAAQVLTPAVDRMGVT